MDKYVVLGIRNLTFLEAYSILDSYRHSIPGYNCQILKGFYFAHGVPAHLCYETEDRKRIIGMLKKELIGGRYTEEFFNAVDQKYRGALSELELLVKADFSNASNKELADYFYLYYKIFLDAYHPMILSIYSSDLDETLFQELSKTSPDPTYMDKEVSTLLAPRKLTPIQREQKLLFAAKVKIERGEDVSEELNQLANEFGPLYGEYLGTPWNAENYKQYIQAIEVCDQVQKLNKIKEKQNEFFEKHNSPFLKKIVIAMQGFSLILDNTKEVVIRAIHTGRPLLEEIAHRTNCSDWIELRSFTPGEIKQMLLDNKQANKALVNERKRHYAILVDGNNLQVWQGYKAAEIAAELVEENESIAQEVVGKIARSGYAKGPVCMITSAIQNSKMKEGAILVTHDTTTELTSIVKKASAIVADQGGIISHTATVAREFGIPCIVNTRIATKIFKDGDLVEVDATKGIARKIR